MVLLSPIMGSQPFRKCHLQILRSLYDGDGDGDGDGGAAPERQNVADERADGSGDGGGVGEGEPPSIVETGDELPANGDFEGPVRDEIWDLVDTFLRRRDGYGPLKEQRVHWTRVHGEARTRLDRLLATTSSREEEAKPSLQLQRSSSLTPRTPLFVASGRGSVATPSLSLQSLTPPSSNRHGHAGRLSQGEREAAGAVPSWHFVRRMLQRRSDLCAESCRSFRSQPFLGRLRDEAEARCGTLEGALKRLKLGRGTEKQDGKKRGGATMNSPACKRLKSGVDHSTPSSLGHFFSSGTPKLTTAQLNDECDHDEEAIMETQMKLCLWSSLLASVKEIVDENDKA
ncbi:hypothetical protein ACHAWF_009193 [Thalassiosira exigua]